MHQQRALSSIHKKSYYSRLQLSWNENLVLYFSPPLRILCKSTPAQYLKSFQGYTTVQKNADALSNEQSLFKLLVCFGTSYQALHYGIPLSAPKCMQPSMQSGRRFNFYICGKAQGGPSRCVGSAIMENQSGVPVQY